MAIRPDWTAGTLTLVAGSKNFTTSGSALESAALQAGDAIITVTGYVLIIEAITGQNSGTLYAECPVAAAGANQPLRIRYQPDGSRVQGAMRMVRELLTTGNLEAFAGLVGRPNAVPMFTGFGTIELVDNEFIGGGAGGSWNAIVLDYAGLSSYADKPTGFRVMVIDAGEQRSALLEKLSDNSDDWSQPVYFTGKTGDPGDKGDPGNDFEPDIVGVLADRSRFNGEPLGFAFLATDTAQLFFRQGGAGGWSAPIAFGGGKPGENGLSAYQIALQEGFTGTEQQWLASLHGSDANVTTSNVGAAVAAASGEQTIVDADSVAGVKSGTSNMRRWTWGIVKAWIKGWITKADVGLSLVDNTSDMNKPVSTSQAAADALKLDKTAQAADSAMLNGKTEEQLSLLGVGQSWSYPGGRVKGTSYQNTTTKPIGFAVAGTLGACEVSSNGTAWTSISALASSNGNSGMIVVPVNHFYRLTTANTNLFAWAELR